MGRITSRRKVVQTRGDGTRSTLVDTLAVEEPLEIRAFGEVMNVTMRTPGADFDLVAGWLVGEGLVRRAGELVAMSYCPGLDDRGRQTYNVVEVVLADLLGTGRAPRTTFASSACGICGTASLESVRVTSHYDVAADCLQMDGAVLAALPDRLRRAQVVFDRTGGLHAAGLFTADGNLLCLREDVGRHNAVDKVIGWALREGLLPLRGHVLQVSGRASFELVQKAAVAGIPVLSAVSAPSSLAADLAEEAGLTLAGFVRGGGFNLYSRPERVPARGRLAVSGTRGT
ncbi:MAG TPA: formate dehydrogenase accessory sulfurtransferase FdhD [Sporichthyaceae bacterium]|jgi:FdhD protein|nr:formate dehydrogenase accessory sulfurtransferase FdhD [Sporichthyaceae bacterium]